METGEFKDFDWLEECEALERHYKEEQAPYTVVKSWKLLDFIKINKIDRYLFCYDYYSVTGGGEPAIIFYAKDGRSITVYNLRCYTPRHLYKYRKYMFVELRASGHYMLCSSIEIFVPKGETEMPF